MSWRGFEQYCFEKKFPDVGGMTFKELFTARPKFVEYSQIWFEATGMFKNWQAYCKGRLKYEQTNKSAA